MLRLTAGFVCLLVVTDSLDSPRYGYESHNGPNSWVNDYPTCNGLLQSPVALPLVYHNHTFLRRLGMYNYELVRPLTLHNDGHTISVGYEEDGQNPPQLGGSLYEPKRKFKMDKIYFRVGSESSEGAEHSVGNQKFPGEIQFFHYDEKFTSFEEAAKVPGGVSVAAVLLQLAKEDNRNLDVFLDKLYLVNGTTRPVSIGNHNLEWTYPLVSKPMHDCEFFMYEGSLTYPPCTEGVLWHVYFDRTAISEKQLDHLRSVVSPKGVHMNKNHRFQMPLNNRKIYQHRELPPTREEIDMAMVVRQTAQKTINQQLPHTIFSTDSSQSHHLNNVDKLNVFSSNGHINHADDVQQAHGLANTYGQPSSELFNSVFGSDYNPKHSPMQSVHAHLPAGNRMPSQLEQPEQLEQLEQLVMPDDDEVPVLSFVQPYVGFIPPSDPTLGGYGK